MKRVIWAVAFLVLAGLGGVAYQTLLVPARSQTAPQPRVAASVPVVIVTATSQSVPVRIDTIGTVQTMASVSIKSRIDGYIDAVLIQDGQYVKKGDLMFRLDGRSAQAQVAQAEAQLARDQAQLANAKHDVQRYAPLVAKDFVSHQQYDTAVTTASALDAAVNADKAAIQNMSALLTYYTISAPIDGRVGSIGIKAGNSIKSNDVPLATINQIKPIYVGFSLPQVELPALRAAMALGPVAVSVRAQGDLGEPIAGKIEFFDNTVDIASGTIMVRAHFDNDDQRLWPGQFVNVSVTTRIDRDAITVPPSAIQIGQDGNFVFVIKSDNTAEARPVEVSRTIDDKSVITKGLATGEQVVVDGQMRLTPGSRVQIRSATSQPRPEPAS